MHRLRRLLLLPIAGAFLLAAFTGGAIASPDARVTLCHRVGGPNYVLITVSPEAVFGNGSGHAANHPLDIIPAFSYTKGGRKVEYAGQNLSAEGIVILGNNCRRPLPAGEDDDDFGGHADEPADPADPMIPEDHVMLCHREDDGEYRDEVVTDDDAVQEHAGHEGDVIPAFDYAMPGGMRRFEGQNLTNRGVELLDHACAMPGPDDEPTPGQPHLRLVKAGLDVNGGTLVPGDVIRFSVVVTNDGSAPAIRTVVTDAVPAGTTFVAGSARVSQGTARVADGYVIAHVGAGASTTHGGTLAAGASETVTFDAQVEDMLPSGAVVVNVAQGSTAADDDSPRMTEDSNEVDLPVDMLPPVPVRMDTDPPAAPTPGTDMPTTVELAPKADLVDAMACITVQTTTPGSMGIASTTCSAPQTVARGQSKSLRLHPYLPRRAAGRCVMLVTSVAAAGHAAREHSTRVCVARAQAEAVVG